MIPLLRPKPPKRRPILGKITIIKKQTNNGWLRTAKRSLYKIAVITLCVLLDLNCKEKSLKKQKVDCTTGATSFSTIFSISFKIKEYIITFFWSCALLFDINYNERAIIFIGKKTWVAALLRKINKLTRIVTHFLH